MGMKKLGLFMICCVCPAVFAQDNPSDNAMELAKKAQNPVAAMVSLPFQ